jgi:predicted DNA-binding protein (UPF0251 family)
MNISGGEIELIINKSRLLNNNTYSENELEQYMVIMEDESQLHRNDIFNLIIKEESKYIFNNFGIVWTFIDKYDFDNIDILKQKYKDYAENKKKEEQEKITNKINELEGNVLLRYLGVKWEETKTKLEISRDIIAEIKAVKQKIKDLVDIVGITLKPENNDIIKGLSLTELNLSCNDKITDEGIKGIPLTSLNLSHNVKILSHIL